MNRDGTATLTQAQSVTAIWGFVWLPESTASWLRDFKLPADSANGSLFNLTMARHAGYPPSGAILPNRVGTSFAKKDATVMTQMPLQGIEFYGSAS